MLGILPLSVLSAPCVFVLPSLELKLLSLRLRSGLSVTFPAVSVCSVLCHSIIWKQVTDEITEAHVADQWLSLGHMSGKEPLRPSHNKSIVRTTHKNDVTGLTNYALVGGLELEVSSSLCLATINHGFLKRTVFFFHVCCWIFSWVTDPVSLLWLVRAHALSHKAFLSGTKSVYCERGEHSFETHGENVTYHIEAITCLFPR